MITYTCKELHRLARGTKLRVWTAPADTDHGVPSVGDVLTLRRGTHLDAEFEPIRAGASALWLYKPEWSFSVVLPQAAPAPAPAPAPSFDPRTRFEPVLSTDSAERKLTPMYSGLLAYAPLALAAVSRVSQRGNDKHNPGEPLHHARGKSSDHADCIVRHSADMFTFNTELQEYEDLACLAWRALILLQELEEKRLGKQPAPGAR